MPRVFEWHLRTPSYCLSHEKKKKVDGGKKNRNFYFDGNQYSISILATKNKILRELNKKQKSIGRFYFLYRRLVLGMRAEQNSLINCEKVSRIFFTR